MVSAELDMLMRRPVMAIGREPGAVTGGVLPAAMRTVALVVLKADRPLLGSKSNGLLPSVDESKPVAMHVESRSGLPRVVVAEEPETTDDVEEPVLVAVDVLQ